MAVKDILKQMGSQASEEGIREQMKKRALEDILGVSASQRQTAFKEAQKRGLGTSGAARLAGTRVREAGTEAAARAAKDIELAEKDKEFSRLGQLAQLGMAEKGQAFQEEMGREQLGLERGRLGLAEEQLGLQEKQFGMEQERLGLAQQELGQKQQQIDLMRSQLDMQKGNDLWDRMETTRRFDQEMDIKEAQMDQAWDMFKQGQLNEKELRNLANDFTVWQTKNAQQFATEQEEIKRYWQSAENDEQRQNAIEVATISGEIQKYIADQQAAAQEKEWYDYAIPAVGAVGGLATGIGSLFKKGSGS